MVSAWQMDGMLSPWKLDVGDSSAPVGAKRIFFRWFASICRSRYPHSTLAEQPQVFLVVVVVPAVRKGDGVDNKVVVQAFRVQMRRHDYLKPFSPHLLRQLHADLMGNLWRDLACLKTLEAVIADNLTRVIPLCFGNHHLVPCGGRVAVHTRDEKLLLSLVAVGGVLHHIAHRLQVRFGIFRVGGLFWVFGVVDGVVEPATHIPYLADRHQPFCFLGSR